MTLAAWAVLAVVLPGVSIGAEGGGRWERRRSPGLVAFGDVPRSAIRSLVGPSRTSARCAARDGTSLAELGMIGRTRIVLDHRIEPSRTAARRIPLPRQGYATDDLGSKLGVVAVQGFGRFGPLGPRTTDSLIRYDWQQDRGRARLGASGAAGDRLGGRSGRRQRASGRRPPTAWAVLVQFLVALTTVTAFLPLAWDRYLLPIQSGAAPARPAGLRRRGRLRRPGGAVPGRGGRRCLSRRAFPGWSRRDRALAPVGVAAILLASFAYFWHARDWNSASRLMLTYSIVDRGTIRIDGLEVQTGDIARFEGHYYTDKQPGYSLAATVPYAIAKAAIGLPDHPLGGPGTTHWPGDYWATLGTGGPGDGDRPAALLVVLAGRLGCGPRASAPGRPGLRPGNARVCLCDDELRPSARVGLPARLDRS